MKACYVIGIALLASALAAQAAQPIRLSPGILVSPVYADDIALRVNRLK